MATQTATASAHADLLEAFANSVDVEYDTDSLTTRSDLTRWLHERGLLARRTPSTEEDLALARQLRSGIRDAMVAHHDHVPLASADLDEASARLLLRMSHSGDGPRLEPVEAGVRGALARILVAVNEAVISEDWTRLKVCPDDTCQLAFYDSTKNRSKSWCGPSCQNKAKTRSYRQRQRTG